MKIKNLSEEVDEFLKRNGNSEEIIALEEKLRNGGKQHLEKVESLIKKNPMRSEILNPLIKWIKYYFRIDDKKYYWDKNDRMVEISNDT